MTPVWIHIYTVCILPMLKKITLFVTNVFREWSWCIDISLWLWFWFCYFQTSQYVEFSVKNNHTKVELNIMISFALPCNCEQHWRVCLYWTRKLSLGLHPVTLCRMRGVFVSFFSISSGAQVALALCISSCSPHSHGTIDAYVFLLLIIVFWSKLQNNHLLEWDDP